MRVQDLARVAIGNKGADFWVVRRGLRSEVGRPVRTYGPKLIGVKVVRPDVVVPDYLFYSVAHLHNKGVFAILATGTTELVNIRVSDIAEIPIVMRS